MLPTVIFASSILQFVILVVDSTDRERLAISKEELYRMLAHEVKHSEFIHGQGPAEDLLDGKNIT